MRKISILFLIIVLSVALFACSNEQGYLDGGSKGSQADLLYLTMEEVSAYNGRDGNQGYIVVQGVIYDVTSKWINGEHMGILAGTDATDQITNAPHGESVLADLTIIGNIVIPEE